jgi:hypothetical protein
VLALFTALLGFGSLAPHVSAQITDANVGQMMASAKTAAEHQALASYFKAQAAAAEQKVKEHEAWLADLKRAGGGGKAYANSLPHCETLIASYRKTQQSYLSMAAEEEKLAKSAQ